MINLEVLEDKPVIDEELGDLLDEFKVVSSPSELSPFDSETHPVEELDVEGCPIKLLELVHSTLQPVEPFLCSLEQVPPVRVRNEVLRLPLPVNPVKVGAFSLKNRWENEEWHVTLRQTLMKVLL